MATTSISGVKDHVEVDHKVSALKRAKKNKKLVHDDPDLTHNLNIDISLSRHVMTTAKMVINKANHRVLVRKVAATDSKVPIMMMLERGMKVHQYDLIGGKDIHQVVNLKGDSVTRGKANNQDRRLGQSHRAIAEEVNT